MTTLTVLKNNNGLELLIPDNILKSLNLNSGSTVEVQTKGDSLILTKQKNIKKYSIDEALPAFQTAEDVGELDWGKPQGKEVW